MFAEPRGERARTATGVERTGLALAAGGVSALVVMAAAGLGGFKTPPIILTGFILLAGGASALEAALSPNDAAGDDRLAHLLALASGLLLAAIWTSGPATYAERPEWTSVAGLVLMSAGGCLRIAAIRRLGIRFNSANRVETAWPLETGGLYRWLAHPSEAGLLLLAAGALVATGGPWQAAMFAGLYLVTAWRVRREETVLTRHFGVVYPRYRATTLDWLP